MPDETYSRPHGRTHGRLPNGERLLSKSPWPEADDDLRRGAATGSPCPWCSTTRSTAPAAPTWRRRSSPPSSRTKCSSWTISAATKARRVRQAIRAAGAHLVSLPSSSPALNPIEQVVAKLKTLVRKADDRCVETVWRRCGALLDHFSPPNSRITSSTPEIFQREPVMP